MSLPIFERAQKEFYKQVAQLSNSNPEIAKLAGRISDGKLRVGAMMVEDTRIATGSKSIEFFKDDDKKTQGLRNISEAQFTKGQFFLPYAIQIQGLYSTSSLDESNVKNRTFKPLHTLGGGIGMENGDVTLRIDDSPLVKELLLRAFDTESQTNMPKGTIIIGDSEIFAEQQKIEAKIRIPFLAPDFVALKVTLWGAGTYPRTN